MAATTSLTLALTLGQALRLARNRLDTVLPRQGQRTSYVHLLSTPSSASSSTSTFALRPRLGLLRRWNHSSASLKAEENTYAPSTGPSEKQDTKRQLAHDRLKPIVDSFEAPVDFAVAYGSGVIHQANRPTSSNEPPPLTDFIISTPSAKAFHKINLRQNPSHYPWFARALGARGIGRLQEHWGAGVWYVTMVNIRGLDVKYGVISTPTLENDLEAWSTLYISGRLQKPHLTLVSPPSLAPAQEANLRNALHLALILLPGRFTEMQLWEKIAGISYAGDPRMSVPGAENPEKVKNIVRGQGVREGFREMYGGLLLEVEGDGVAWAGDAKAPKGVKWEWKGEGEAELEQSTSTEHVASLLLTLPPRLLRPIAKHYRTTMVGSLVDKEVRAQRKTETVGRRQVPPEREFWERVAEDERVREVVLNELRHIIRRPALTQSIKGLFTAGFVKSFQYSLAKFRKWLAARKPTPKGD